MASTPTFALFSNAFRIGDWCPNSAGVRRSAICDIATIWIDRVFMNERVGSNPVQELNGAMSGSDDIAVAAQNG